MSYIFTLTFLAGLVLLVIGLIRPGTALFWKKGVAGRKQSTIIYSLIVFVSFVGLIVTDPMFPTSKAEWQQARKEMEIKDAEAAKTAAERTKREAEKEEQEKHKQAITAAVPVQVSATEALRELSRSCDTSYEYYPKPPEEFGRDTGWITAGENKPWYADDGLNMGQWEIPTYRVSGDHEYDIDDSRKLVIYQKVYIHSGYREVSKKAIRVRGYYMVSPIGSSEIYKVDINCLTRKDLSQCTVVQKAKNGFNVRARYIPPRDPSKRALEISRNGKYYPINIPTRATLLVLDYNPERDRLWCLVYNEKGKQLTNAEFDVSTILEIR